MTFSDCWIDSVDDEDFLAYIAEQKRLGVRRALRLDLLPRLPAAHHYWIPALQEWAAARELRIQHIDRGGGRGGGGEGGRRRGEGGGEEERGGRGREGGGEREERRGGRGGGEGERKEGGGGEGEGE